MSLLKVVQEACAVVGVHRPAAVIASVASDRTMFEMLALANEMGERMATDARDWTMLRKSVALVGTGVITPPSNVVVGTEAFDLPSDYRRMLTNGSVWGSASTMAPMRFVPDTDQWFQRRAANYTDGRGEWTIYGGQIHIWPIMMGPVAATATAPAIAAATARFTYLEKNFVNGIDASGQALGPKDEFLNDTDTFRLDERLLKLGMVWQWKANKGSPYAEDMGTYQDAIAWAMGTDSPAPIMIGRQTISMAARTAYPWPAPT